MASQKAKREQSRTLVVTSEEAAALANKWQLSGKVRVAFVSWLPQVTKDRQDVWEPAFRTLKRRTKLRKGLTALRAHLVAANWILCGEGDAERRSAADGEERPNFRGEIVREAGARLLDGVEQDSVAWRRVEQNVDSKLLAVQELILLAEGALSRVDDEKAPGGRARPQDDLLARTTSSFHARWLKNVKLAGGKVLARETCCRKVLRQAGVADGSIETLLKAAVKPRPGSVSPSSTLLGDTEMPPATKDDWRKRYVSALVDEGICDPEGAEAWSADLRDEEIDLSEDLAKMRRCE